MGHLKRSGLKLHSFSRRITQQEPKVDVQYVALNVNQNITIVSVLDLKNIANKAVRGQTTAEVLTRQLLPSSVLRTKLPIEIVQQGAVITQLFLQSMN